MKLQLLLQALGQVKEPKTQKAIIFAILSFMAIDMGISTWDTLTENDAQIQVLEARLHEVQSQNILLKEQLNEIIKGDFNAPE